MSVDICTPMLPESISEATVLAWHKNVGESFKRDELLIELETEKVVLEIPAPRDGVLNEIRKASGEITQEGDILGVLEPSNGTTAVESSAEGDDQVVDFPAAPETSNPPAETTESEQTESLLSPAAARIVHENDIDVGTVAATGKDGRITKGDVLAVIEQQSQSLPQALDSTEQSEDADISADAHNRTIKRQRMSRIRQTIADRLVYAQHSAAMLTTFNEVDLSAVIALRAKYRDDFENKHSARLGFMSFFVKAAVEALQDNPAVNAMIDGEDVVYHHYCDVGIAVSSPRGLVVPILRNAESMGFAEIEKQIRDFGSRAESGSLTLDELTGGTFTITNGGVFGSLVSTPILNPPQSAILGMHKIQERPVAANGEVVIRPMMYLALTYDHRIIDGREAVGFLVSIKDSLEDPARLLLEI